MTRPSTAPSIRTTTVGSYPLPDWLSAMPSEQALIDATRMVFALQRQAGIDLPTDGEFYRFDVNHPDTNGMIDYFVRPLAGLRSQVGRRDADAFAAAHAMGFRAKPAGVIESALDEGSLNILADCRRAASVAGGPFKFTLTSPYMLGRTLLDHHYPSLEKRVLALADVLAAQVRDLPCACLQVDEANLPGSPEHAPLAAAAINRVLDAFTGEKAVHLCFGNYGGQSIQQGTWTALLGFLSALHVDHLVLESAHRPIDELEAFDELNPALALGLGMIDVKINRVETPEDVARRIAQAIAIVGEKRLAWVDPDCGFWMLKRSVADRKIAALAAGRDLFLGRQSQA